MANAWGGPVTQVDTVAKYPLGQLRHENGREYRYVKAAGALAVNEGCNVDVATDTTGNIFKQCVNTVTGVVVGVSETAIASGSFGWVTVRGSAQCKVANGTAVGDVLAGSGTAGILAKPANTDITAQRIAALEANSSGSAAVKAVYLS